MRKKIPLKEIQKRANILRKDIPNSTEVYLKLAEEYPNYSIGTLKTLIRVPRNVMDRNKILASAIKLHNDGVKLHVIINKLVAETGFSHSSIRRIVKMETLKTDNFPVKGETAIEKKKDDLGQGMIDIYFKWYQEQFKVGVGRLSQVQFRYLRKDLPDYFKPLMKNKLGQDPSDNDILKAWVAVLKSYDKWSFKQKSNITPMQISSNLPSIIATIQAAKTGTGSLKDKIADDFTTT